MIVVYLSKKVSFSNKDWYYTENEAGNEGKHRGTSFTTHSKLFDYRAY